MRFIMLQFMNVTKALSDENRIRILMALHQQGELCVCHLIDLLGLAPSTVSKHLFLLKNARLIVARKDGRWVHYSPNRANTAPASVTDALAWVVRSVADDPVIKADRERLDHLLTGSLEAGCGS
jgi:DNA-binding transcriptional ArsR family regulator